MHELHLVRNLLSDIIETAQKNAAHKVTKVYLKLGKFTEIDEGIVRHFFKENSQNTLLQGAELSIEKSPTRELRLISFDCE